MGRPDLAEYAAKRDFSATPEPAGDGAAAAGDGLRFVIQEHSATRLHWDLRLERDGALASWALPNGLPWAPKDNRVAVHTEDLAPHATLPVHRFTFESDALVTHDATLRALTIVNAEWGLGFGARRITLSTSGLVPKILRLADEPHRPQ